MKPSVVRPPHLGRLVARVRALDGPLVQLWAWPGAGQQAVLDALVEDARFGQPLSLDDLADAGSAERAAGAALETGARWLVLPAVSAPPAGWSDTVAAIARHLGPGRRLVFSSPRRHPQEPLACSYLFPQELLLDREEIAELWREVVDTPPGPQLVARLAVLTDGWYRPLRLVAEAAAAAGGSLEPESLLDLPAVASFLRHEVLGELGADEQTLLVRLSAGGRLGPELWRGLFSDEEEATRRRLVELWGLGLEDGGSLRMPYLLRWFLARERRERWTAARGRELASRLAAAELELGRPVSALEHLVEAGEPKGVDRLFADHWPQLLTAASLGLLGRMFERLEGLRSPELDLARALVDGLLWQREAAALEDLRRLGGRGRERRERRGGGERGERPETGAGETGGGEEEIGERKAGEAAAGETISGAVAQSDGPESPTAVPTPTAAAARLTAAALAVEAGLPRAETERAWAEAPPELRPLARLVEAAGRLAAARRAPDGGAEGAAAALIPALERVPASAGGARDRGRLRGDPPVKALFDRGLLHLLDEHPELEPALSGRADLPDGWRRWLAALPPAALAREASGYLVTLLGKPTVRLKPEGRPPVDLVFPLERAFLVFAYLATAPGFEASRDELVEAIWADEDEETVEKNFHPTLSYLRRALAPEDPDRADRPLLLRRGVYRLNARLSWNVDAVDLVRWTEEGHRRRRDGQPEQALVLWGEAWRLYTGPLLAGFDAPWITERRDALGRVYVEMLRSFGDTAERLGRLTEAMDAYRTALIEDPLQEPVHLALMRIYARQGRRDHVRRQYERLVGQLREELNVEPMPETVDTYHRLMG